jgi:hypothetical protein
MMKRAPDSLPRLEDNWPEGAPKFDPEPPRPLPPPHVVVKAYPYEDGKHVLLITDKGARLFHEIGDDRETGFEGAYRTFLAKGHQ